MPLIRTYSKSKKGRKIKQVVADVFEGRFNGLVAYDENDNLYKITAGTLYSFLEGREIKKARKSRVYYHIDEIGEKNNEK